MKAIKVSEFEIIKCGVEFITGLDARPGVEELLPHMERNENYVYWMLPKGGSTEQQQACICVNGTFYALNNKLEKAIFRNVRLTRDFKNYERMVDGTQKLVIPHRLFQEKLRTSNRNNNMERKGKAPKKQVPRANAKESERQTSREETPNAEKATHASEKATHASEVAASIESPHKPQTKRPRKAKNDVNVHSILEGFKRRKLNFEVSDVLAECEASMHMQETPLVQTPRTFFKSLCGVFDLEFPGVLSEAAIDTVVSTLGATQEACACPDAVLDEASCYLQRR